MFGVLEVSTENRFLKTSNYVEMTEIFNKISVY